MLVSCSSEDPGKLDRILAQGDPDEVWSDIQDLILRHKEEEDWSRVEENIIVLGSMDRWILNGGFKGYLRMPASSTCGEAIRALGDIGQPDFQTVLKRAISAFPGSIELEDVDGRQAFELDDEAMAILEEADGYYFANYETGIYEAIADYIRKNRDALSWLDDPKYQEP